MTNITPDQEKGLRALLKLIATTHTLISNGLFPGVASQSVAQVLQWLGQYHKDVKYQLPVEPEKVKATVVQEEKVEDMASVAVESTDGKVGA